MKTFLLSCLSAGLCCGLWAEEAPDLKITCANLVYGKNQTSKCFSKGFLVELEKRTHIKTTGDFSAVHLESDELFEHPFAIMSGEGSFTLSKNQQDNLRFYLLNGGFLLASAGCSSTNWQKSFDREVKALFPDRTFIKLEKEHPIFHTVSDVNLSKYKSGDTKFPDLYGMEIDGRIVVVYSPDGLNDTASMETGGCCCCGGNEVKAAKYINMNLLAFALTH